MGARQREISVSEFFTKNRHLLGFDNPRKALLTTVKEAVDNSLDACEEAGILPDIVVKVDNVSDAPVSQATRFRITITDNGIIPMKERVVDRRYDPLVWLGSKIFRRGETPQTSVTTAPCSTEKVNWCAERLCSNASTVSRTSGPRSSVSNS